jgi:hypothetical protein
MAAIPPTLDRWATARAGLPEADSHMAEAVDAEPTLDPDTVLDRWASDLWDALVFQVVGQQLSVAATQAILARLEALHDGRLATPTEMLFRRTAASLEVGSRALSPCTEPEKSVPGEGAQGIHCRLSVSDGGRCSLRELIQCNDECLRLGRAGSCGSHQPRGLGT